MPYALPGFVVKPEVLCTFLFMCSLVHQTSRRCLHVALRKPRHNLMIRTSISSALNPGQPFSTLSRGFLCPRQAHTRHLPLTCRARRSLFSFERDLCAFCRSSTHAQEQWRKRRPSTRCPSSSTLTAPSETPRPPRWRWPSGNWPRTWSTRVSQSPCTLKDRLV